VVELWCRGYHWYGKKVSPQAILEINLKELNGQYLNIDELASYISRSKGAIRNLVLRRAIPYRKPAGRLIFLKEEIDKWIKFAPGQTLDEIKSDF
jgi:hypothetical protein